MYKRTLIEEPLDIDKCFGLAQKGNKEEIKSFISEFELEPRGDHIYFANNENVDYLFTQIIGSIFSRITFSDPIYLIKTLVKLYQKNFQPHEYTSYLYYHVNRLSIENIEDLIDQGLEVPSQVIFTYFDLELSQTLIGRPVENLTERELKVIGSCNDTVLIKAFYDIINCDSFQSFTSIINLEYKEKVCTALSKLFNDDAPCLDEDEAAIFPDYFDYFLKAARFLNEEKELDITLIRNLIHAFNTAIESIHFTVGHGSLIESKLIDVISIEAFRFYLSSFEPQDHYARLLEKYIGVRWYLTSNRFSVGSDYDYLDYFTDAESQIMLEFDETFISTSINKNIKTLSEKDLHNLLIKLLFSEKEADTGFGALNIIRTSSSEQHAQNNASSEEFYFSVADILGYGIGSHQFNHIALSNICQGVTSRLQELDRFEEHQVNSYKVSSRQHEELLYFYDFVTEELVQRGDKKHIHAIEALTSSLFTYLHQLPDFESYAEGYITLCFFQAYYGASDDKNAVVKLYKRVIESDSGYRDSAINNLLNTCIDQGDVDSAKQTLLLLSSENQKDKIDSFNKRISELERKIALTSGLFGDKEQMTSLSEVSNINLALLTAVIIGVLDQHLDTVQHDQSKPFSWLVCDYYTSQKIIYGLVEDRLLIPADDSWKAWTKPAVTIEDVTSLELIPNTDDFITYELLLAQCQDEISNRDYTAQEVDSLNRYNKMGWMFNTFYFNIDKNFERPEHMFTRSDYDEIEALVSVFSPAQLASIAWNAVNFVSGNMINHGFGHKIAMDRMPKRLLKVLRESQDIEYRAKTFERNARAVLPIEKMLTWLDGVSYTERYIQR